MSRSQPSVLTYRLSAVKNDRYMGGVIRADRRNNICVCKGTFVSTTNPNFTHKVPTCNLCGAPPKLLKVRVTLPALGKCDIRYNQKGTRLSTLSLADAFLQDVHDEIKRGIFDPTRYLSPRKRYCLKIGALLDDYLARKQQRVGKERGCSPAYLHGAETSIRLYLKPFFGEMDVRDLRHRHLVDFMETFDRAERQKIKALQLLRPVLRRASKLIDGLGVPEFPTLRPAPMKKNFIDYETQQLIFSRVTVYREAIQFGILYLLRPCELRALKWGDIDRKRNVITVQRHWSKKMLLHGRKSASDPNDRYHKLELPLTPSALAVLRALPPCIDGNEFLFRTSDGKSLGQGALDKAWKRACKRAGVALHSFYDGVRHAGATHMINAGVPIEQIRTLCGHTSSDTTYRYAESDTLSLAETIEKAREGAQRGRIFPVEDNIS